jgi:hypothetical protein
MELHIGFYPRFVSLVADRGSGATNGQFVGNHQFMPTESLWT